MMEYVERARVVHVAAIAQAGFQRLVQELVEQGITESQAIEILLAYAQLKAGEQGHTGETLSLN